MLFRKTMSSRVKKMVRGKDQEYKSPILMRVTTYWVLFVPVLQIETPEG